ncbi:hypothetical protein [Clostridium chromiireducens]|uniref:Uncharacterized protein n=1 Tax=Clostridium chromiireducens TaxID=225345 RepID=A0A1V4IZU3_9CLOT|nr:hypothetical protein [Clostridium chromiireducens]MVX64026.1 hypothetical protein [Clostridium chromiireducens]OPJ65419.1 hypothetical protein CLCHR_08090 [Clostridium chromiireducens]
MDKEEVIIKNKFNALTASEILRELYSKELDSKKNILEYIDITRVLS